MPAHNLENGRVDRGFLSIGRSLAVSAKRFPNKVALHDPDRKITYLELNEKVNQLAHGLRSVGVARG
ncbi:MAG: AMP-binding protein, partial [Candidatus Binatia bacterium]